MATETTAKKATPKPPAAAKKTAAKTAASRTAPASRQAAKPRAKAAAPVKSKAKKPAAPKEKIKKSKLVRDSFTMPEAEYQGLGDIKKACLKAGFSVKKSELLRIGVALIRKMDAGAIKGVLASLPPLKAGRPKKDK